MKFSCFQACDMSATATRPHPVRSFLMIRAMSPMKASIRPTRSEALTASHIIARLAPALALATVLAACSQDVGDFGRPQPGVLHDTLMPKAGNYAAENVRGELVSAYDFTDNEVELRKRAWALVQPPNQHDWFGNSLVELQRTRILPEIDTKYDARAYYQIIRRQDFASSETRWQRLIDDMRVDAGLIGPFWGSLRQVNADDAERVHALDRRRDLTPGELHDAYARIDENARLADWVWRAMRFRLKSYRICIDRLEVETPTRRLWEVNEAFDKLQAAIAQAEAGSAGLRLALVQAGPAKASRYTMQKEIHEVVPQK